MTEALRAEKHLAFVSSYFEETTSLCIGAAQHPIRSEAKVLRDIEKMTMSHIKMNVLYWATCALFLLEKEWVAMFRKEVFSYVLSCWQPSIGGFSQVPNGEVSLLATLSALQVLLIVGEEDRFFSQFLESKKHISSYVFSLQEPNGSWTGDIFGEVDTRFTYAAFSILSLLSLTYSDKQMECLRKAVDYLIDCCRNPDGGFGAVAGAESHAGQIFCCVSALSIAEKVFNLNRRVDQRLLKEWLAYRQDTDGGLNGRPQKLVDVCYSWWVISSLKQLSALDWIDRKKCIEFILSCQDMDDGGFSDRPGDAPDIYHTFFAISGLLLLSDEALMDEVYCLPIDRLPPAVRHKFYP